jgi:hypothetical protein
MAAGADPVPELAALDPDARLLAEDLPALPDTIGRPEPIPPSRAGRRIVALGVALTGTTLVLGCLLLALGAVLVLGGSNGAGVAALVAGAVLAGTHWGWVHVAELSNQHLERRDHQEIVDRRATWLAAIEPYARTNVTTRATTDGGLEIVTVRHEPHRASAQTFTFSRREVAIERHSAEEPAAVIAERAETLRAAAAAETERARETWAAAAGAHELEQIRATDQAEREAADHAAAQALAEQLNANLRSPPLE